MNTLEIKLNAAIEILEKKEKKMKNVIDYFKKKSKSGLLDLHKQHYGKSVKK